MPETTRTFRDYDGADEFEGPLFSLSEGQAVRVEFAVLPGTGEGPPGKASVETTVEEVLFRGGDRDGPGRTFVRLLLSTDEGDAYRLRYRGVAPAAEAWIEPHSGEDPFSGSTEWGRSRRVYAVEVQGNGITARRERPGHSFLFVQDEESDTDS